MWWRIIIPFLSAGLLLSGCGSEKTEITSYPVNEPQMSSSVGLDSMAESETIDASSSSIEKAGGTTLSDTDGTIDVTRVDITFDYDRVPGQASKQLAVWIEDSDGNVVKTLYVSNFTGRARGYEKRKDALNHWVSAAKPEEMTDDEIDAVSGATPDDGSQRFSWDLTDEEGRTVPAGVYSIYLEGTLFWSSNVVYKGSIDLTDSKPGVLDVQEERSEPGNKTNETMILNVRMEAI